jgi:hypothetical protein
MRSEAQIARGAFLGAEPRRIIPVTRPNTMATAHALKLGRYS